MRRSIRPAILIGLLTSATALLSACMPFGGASDGSFPVAADLQAETVVSAAQQPAALAFASDGRVFYTEKNTGRIRVVSKSALLEAPFAEVPVNMAGDRGLLGIALHPDFDQNGRVYVLYSRSDSGAVTSNAETIFDHRVVYFTAGGNVAAGGEIFVVSLPAGDKPTGVGGRIAFAPDGKLMVALGAMGDPEAAQNPALLLGKLLRYNDDGSIPDDNPTAGSAVFASGLRDPRGLTFDPQTGVAFVTDLNGVRDHEVNRVVASANLGWPNVRGRADTTAEKEFAAAAPNYADPIIDTLADDDRPIGGGFNPSDRYGADARGRYYYGVSTAAGVIQVVLGDDRSSAARSTLFASRFGAMVTDVAFTPAGTLYVATQNSIFRVAPISSTSAGNF